MTSVSTAWGRELEKIGRGNRVFHRWPGPWPKRPPSSWESACISSLSFSFHFWHHVTTKENKNERFTGLSPGYQIVSLFGSFQTHTHAKWEIHRCVALTFGAKPWKLQKFSTVSLLSLSTIFSVKSTAKWVTKKCSEWLCFLCPVQCTFLFVWDKNHYMPQQTAKNKIK